LLLPDVRGARAQLLEVHSSMVQAGGSGSRKFIQVLSLLVGVLLELGLVKEAEEYANKVMHADDESA